ncbi:MAG: 3-phosphoshikimate 1-carboxyvinyltransferase [Velocimicrobium sp.]
MKQKKATSLKGELTIPGDKSISHRAIMLGSISKGITEVTNFLKGADCLSTISCFQKMGIQIKDNGNVIEIYGKGLYGLSTPSEVLDVGNSGTTARLMSGILSGQLFESTMNGDASIQRRPMNRIISPLSSMGAVIESIHGTGCVPLKITPAPLHGIHYLSPVASAQIKSSILLAGLYADGETSVTEPVCSRNHTELMLRYFGGSITTNDTTATIIPNAQLYGQKVDVPGDISSAAYFMAAAAIVPNSEVLIKNVGINETRDGMITVMQEMGANITLQNERLLCSEPVADLLVKSSSLHGVTIGGTRIPSLIDELPILAVLASFANGTTIIKDAQELKVKESNRINVVVHNLSLMGVDVRATDDGMIIKGGNPLKGAVIETNLDHRIAMSFSIAGLIADGTTTLKNGECVDISYPNFYEDLHQLIIA